MPVLVKYACGCIGLPPHEHLAKGEGQLPTESAMAFVLYPCDGDSNYLLVEREVSLSQKASNGLIYRRAKLLPIDKCREHLGRANSLLADGCRLREIRNLLDIK